MQPHQSHQSERQEPIIQVQVELAKPDAADVAMSFHNKPGTVGCAYTEICAAGVASRIAPLAILAVLITY